LCFSFPQRWAFYQSEDTVILKTFSEDKVTLKEGMPIYLELTEEVSSSTHETGQIVHFVVSRDIVVDGYIVIEKGAVAQGSITLAEEAGRVGDAGKIYFQLDKVRAVNGENISLRSTIGQKGEDAETKSVALGVVCCPLFLLMKGKEAVYSVGTEFRGYVAFDYDFYPTELKRK
jgi:hypothetical protein